MPKLQTTVRSTVSALNEYETDENKCCTVHTTYSMIYTQIHTVLYSSFRSFGRYTR